MSTVLSPEEIDSRGLLRYKPGQQVVLRVGAVDKSWDPTLVESLGSIVSPLAEVEGIFLSVEGTLSYLITFDTYTNDQPSKLKWIVNPSELDSWFITVESPDDERFSLIG